MQKSPKSQPKPITMQFRTSIAIAAALGLSLSQSTWLAGAAHAEKLTAVTGRLGNACKLKVVEQFDVPMADARVQLGATLKDSLDSGAMTMKEVKASGLSFDWSVTGKKAKGYCNVDYNGTVKEFKQW